MSVLSSYILSKRRGFTPRLVNVLSGSLVATEVMSIRKDNLFYTFVFLFSPLDSTLVPSRSLAVYTMQYYIQINSAV